METSLHQQLKHRYGPDRGGRTEVVFEGYRIDAVDEAGVLVEVQSGALGPLRTKVSRLVAAGHRVRVVKPVVLERFLVRRKTAKGPVVSRRRSPARGSLLDVFEDLVGMAGVLELAGAGLELDIVGVSIEEWRVDRRRRPGYSVTDRVLLDVRSTVRIGNVADLWHLAGSPALPQRFTTRDVAEAMGRPLWFAQKVAYCLRHSGAATVDGKSGRLVRYVRVAA